MRKVCTLFTLCLLFFCVTVVAQNEGKRKRKTKKVPKTSQISEAPPTTVEETVTTPPTDELTEEDTGPKAKVVWESKGHKFGNIAQGIPVVCRFKFVNEGEVPLLISNVKPSCGCTATDWPKEPIPPGGSGEITAEYNAKKIGNFTKTLTVKSNAEKPVQRLMLRGKVVGEKVPAAAPANDSDETGGE